MARVDQVQLRLWNIAQIRPRTLDGKEGIVLAPDNQRLRLLVTEELWYLTSPLLCAIARALPSQQRFGKSRSDAADLSSTQPVSRQSPQINSLLRFSKTDILALKPILCGAGVAAADHRLF